MQYYMPVRLRSQAKDRTAGLGVTALDIDAVEPTPKAPEAGEPHTTAPPEQKPTSILSSTEVAVTFKLMDLVADFLEPLKARLGNEKHFFGDYPSSLDCLAVGYLALCFYPELPQPWLANEMKKSFPRMCGYLNDLKPQLVGEFVDAKSLLAYTHGGERVASMLPWGVAERGDLPWMSMFLVEKALDAMGWGRSNELRKQRIKEEEENMDPMDLERKRKAQAAARRQRIKSVLTVAGGVATFVGYCVWMLQTGSQYQAAGEDVGEEGEVKEYIIVDDDGEEEDDEEEEDEEEEEEDEETRKAREAEELEIIERMKGESGKNAFGLAGAILGLNNPRPRPQVFSPEEEEEIAEDIQEEENEVDEAIARDVEENIQDKSE
jgi:sorting and assembly machinery component 37